MSRLSFIVPFYNVELYIEECIRSLYHQDIPQEEYEVICVDDCSPDGSRAIVERLQKEYPTLRLMVHTENKRQGGARNTAMQVAQGRYIWFVDSDDYIKPNCMKDLLERAEREDLDILDFDFDADYSKQPFRKNVESYEMGPCSGADYVFSQRQGRWSWRCVCVWGGLIKRSLVSDMQFREKVQYEDNDYAIRMYARAKRVHHIPEKPYYYRVVTDSTVHHKITLTQIEYNIQLLHAYTGMYDELKSMDFRWGAGIEELIKYVSVQILRQLKEVSDGDRRLYYKSHMGYMPDVRQFIGKKVWLSLNSNVLRKVLYI